MLINVKSVRQKVKVMQKQINKEAILVLDSHINNYIDKLLSKQVCKRITEKNIQL